MPHPQVPPQPPLLSLPRLLIWLLSKGISWGTGLYWELLLTASPSFSTSTAPLALSAGCLSCEILKAYKTEGEGGRGCNDQRTIRNLFVLNPPAYATRGSNRPGIFNRESLNWVLIWAKVHPQKTIMLADLQHTAREYSCLSHTAVISLSHK